jgi:hypothetical protein
MSRKLSRVPALVAGAAVVAAFASTADGSTRSITPAIVLDRSIGGVALGDTRARVERRTGGGLIIAERDERSADRPLYVVRLAYNSTGHYVTYSSAGTTQSALRARVVQAVETTWTVYRTPEGVHVGSSLSEVKTISGVRCFHGNAVCEHGYGGAGRPGTSFLIDLSRRRVVRIVISSRP